LQREKQAGARADISTFTVMSLPSASYANGEKYWYIESSYAYTVTFSKAYAKFGGILMVLGGTVMMI
jgi:hypothetical protein